MISGSSGRCTFVLYIFSLPSLFKPLTSPSPSSLSPQTNNHLSLIIIAKMHLPLPLLSILLLIPTFTLACTPTCTTPTPTRAFTVAAFESPWPPGSNSTLSHGVSGLIMRAQGGAFWFNPDPDTNRPNTACPNNYASGCPPGNQTVLWVDLYGKAWLVSHVQLRISHEFREDKGLHYLMK
jgi:hypothetical protein